MNFDQLVIFKGSVDVNFDVIVLTVTWKIIEKNIKVPNYNVFHNKSKLNKWMCALCLEQFK